MSYYTSINFFIFVPVCALIRNILYFQDCIFICNYKYLSSRRMKINELSARYWYSVSLLKLFPMKSFWKFDGISSWSLISPNVVSSLPRAPWVPSFKLLLKYLLVMTSTRMPPPLLFLIFLSIELMSNEETALQFVGSRACTKGDNSMIIAADGPVNNMSHVVKTESTWDFLLWYSLVEVLANHLDTSNSSILKSFLRESIENLLIILALSAQLQDILTSSLILSNFSHIFVGCSKHFSWLCCRLVFHISWFEISETLWTKIHLSREEFSVLREHIQNR